MTWEINEKEFGAVRSLPAPKRYEYALKRIADYQRLWGLYGQKGGWLQMADESENPCMPLWPHQRYAEAFVDPDENEKFAAKDIHINAFLERWIPGMEKDGVLIAVFPVDGGKGITVQPRKFECDLRAELAKIE